MKVWIVTVHWDRETDICAAFASEAEAVAATLKAKKDYKTRLSPKHSLDLGISELVVGDDSGLRYYVEA